MRFLILILTAMIFLTNSSLAQDHNLAPYTLQWSPDGLWIARGYTDGIVAVTSLNNADETIEFKHDGNISAIAWSPDASRVAVGLYANENISIWDLGTESLIKRLRGDKVYNGGGMYIAWNPKQEILVSIADDWESGGNPLRFWETLTYSHIGVGEVFAVYPISSSLQWSPDGTQLAIATLTQDLRIYDVFRGENTVSKYRIEGFPLPSGISYVDWSPHGTQLAVIKYETQFSFDEKAHVSVPERDSFMVVLDAITLKDIAQITQPVHNAMAPFLWSPDGSRIAILYPDKIEVIDEQTGALLDHISALGYSLNAAWSPFGGRLAVAGPSDQPSTIEDVQILVPAPSLSLLNSIAATCAPDASLPTTDDLTAYIEAINDDPSISQACAADLIAVAEALHAEQIAAP